MNIILKLKNWQLFIITFLLPIIIVLIKLSTVDQESYTTEEFNSFLAPISIIYYALLIIWNYRVTKTFNKFETALTQKQLKLLDLLLTVLIIYVIYQITHEFLGISQLLITTILYWIFTLTSVFAVFYIIYCSAKTIKYLQLKNQLRTPDIIIEMILIFYFPIGVWWLQKKVNRYYNEYNAHTANSK